MQRIKPEDKDTEVLIILKDEEIEPIIRDLIAKANEKGYCKTNNHEMGWKIPGFQTSICSHEWGTGVLGKGWQVCWTVQRSADWITWQMWRRWKNVD